MPPEDKARQIEATRKLGEMLNSLGNIESDEHRISYAYNAVCDAVVEICRKHQVSGKPCFNQTEIECITEVSFQLFSILDSKIKPPPPPSSALEAVAREYKALPRLKKWKAIGTLLGAMLTVIGIVEGAKKIYEMGTAASPTVKPALK